LVQRRFALLSILAIVLLAGAFLAFNHVFVSQRGRIWTPSDLFASTVERVLTRDAQFFEGGEDTVNSVIQAFVMQELWVGRGGLCNSGITCEGRVILRAGTGVRFLRSIHLQNNAINETLDLVQASNRTGWITDRACRTSVPVVAILWRAPVLQRDEYESL
jgi:hypothetical protein